MWFGPDSDPAPYGKEWEKNVAWFNAGLHPAMNHAFCSPILPLPNSPFRVA
jgi:hypothetical protein